MNVVVIMLKSFFPDRPTKQLAGLFDVDHIISDIKHTLGRGTTRKLSIVM